MSIADYLNIKQFNDLAICERPQGITQHGFAEWVEEKIKTKIYTYETLEFGASGLVSFALSFNKATEMTELFQRKSICKNYLFITDQIISKTTLIIATDDLKTQFELIKKYNKFCLWKATSFSNQTDKIRLHAKKAAIPILGDVENDGSPFFRICLHRTCLEIPDYDIFTSPPPEYFDNLNLLENTFLCKLEDALHRRYMLYLKNNNANNGCFRLLHNEIDLLKIDIYANHWWIYDYGISKKEKENLLSFIESHGSPPYYIREMKNRGQSPGDGQLSNGNLPQLQWLAKENIMTFELRANQGMSPGLFLDQKENRNWVFENSEGKTVLNLFSYTGGFSVAAALGKAKSVTTVDLSKTFIEWSKINFKLNNLNVEDYEFWAADSRIFIDGCFKRNKTFDLIICDPPSFSRGKDGIFRIDTDVSALIQSLWNLLAPNGIILFCTNFEKWDLQQLKENISLFKQEPVKLITPPLIGLDFELPEETHILKTLLLQKKTGSRNYNI